MSSDCEWYTYAAYIPQIYKDISGSGKLGQVLQDTSELGSVLEDVYVNVNTILQDTQNIEGNHEELMDGLGAGFHNIFRAILSCTGVLAALFSQFSKKLFPSSPNYLKLTFTYTASNHAFSYNIATTNGFLNDEADNFTGNDYTLIQYFPYETLSVKNYAKYLVVIALYVSHTNWLLQSLCYKILGKKATDELLRTLAVQTEE